jgi:hypothetical protein
LPQLACAAGAATSPAKSRAAKSDFTVFILSPVWMVSTQCQKTLRPPNILQFCGIHKEIFDRVNSARKGVLFAFRISLYDGMCYHTEYVRFLRLQAYFPPHKLWFVPGGLRVQRTLPETNAPGKKQIFPGAFPLSVDSDQEQPLVVPQSSQTVQEPLRFTRIELQFEHCSPV